MFWKSLRLGLLAASGEILMREKMNTFNWPLISQTLSGTEGVSASPKETTWKYQLIKASTHFFFFFEMSNFDFGVREMFPYLMIRYFD